MEEVILKNLDVVEIQQYQQNRYPCLFIDHIDDIKILGDCQCREIQ